jgi:hypothetical protein
MQNSSENDDSYRALHGTSEEIHLSWLQNLELVSTSQRFAVSLNWVVYQLSPLALTIGFSVILIIVLIALSPN